MKAFLFLLSLAISWVDARAQADILPNDPPDLIVLKSSWSKERINWERDPFSGPNESFDEMRVRVRNDKRMMDAKRGGSQIEMNKVEREARADAAIFEGMKQKGPPRYVFLYKVTVKNSSAKTIKAIDWDYVFFRNDTQSEAGRLEFTSAEKIGSGKTKELDVMARQAPAKTVSVYALDKTERQGLDGQVVIVRLEYTDGSVWQRP